MLNKLDKLDEKLDDIKVDQAETRIALEKHERRDEEIHNDVKQMGAEIAHQSKLLGEYNESLREHMRRTELLENKVEPIHKEWLNKKIVKRHNVKTWKKIVAISAGITAVAGALLAINQFISLF